MATPGALAQRVRGSAATLSCVLVFFGCLCAASPSHGQRLICWQAIMNCQAEPECNYAYDQYTRACGPVLSGQGGKCPSHCISSLVQLNLTKSGPALEDCSCAYDTVCALTKRYIEPCLPRTISTGCTDARLQCERDYSCSTAMHGYLRYCRKLFSGSECTNACRSVIAKLRKIPKGQQLDSCMCDGKERAICEFVKNRMDMLCDDSRERFEASGNDGSDQEEHGGDDSSDPDHPEEMESRSSAPPAASRASWTLLASILALLLLV